MNYRKMNIAQYFKHLRGWFIAGGIALVILIITIVAFTAKPYYPSGNNSRVHGDRRVFDYGDQLSDSEEEKLEAYIHEAEKKTCMDIVIVTLNESLENFAPSYMAGYDMYISPDRYVMVYADKFWEDNKFGYDQPQILDGRKDTGDGVILVDNVYREATGKIYTWMGTTGQAYSEYSSSMIDSALDDFYDHVEDDYYRACIDWVDAVVDDLGGHPFELSIPAIVISVLGALIYISVKRQPEEGKMTVTARTYLDASHYRYSQKSDTFIRTALTKRYDPPSSSSGGGGHRSGGGGHHGGGGHSR